MYYHQTGDARLMTCWSASVASHTVVPNNEMQKYCPRNSPDQLGHEA
jgi:hypothetical protein